MAPLRTQSLIWWLVGMLLIPPAMGVLFGFMRVEAGLLIYTLMMLGLGVCAATAITEHGFGRAALGVALAVGMLFVQGAVFFIGCSMIMHG